MERKNYLPPESTLLEVTTEQGICYSSDEAAKIEGATEAQIEVSEYTDIDNDITFK